MSVSYLTSQYFIVIILVDQYIKSRISNSCIICKGMYKSPTNKSEHCRVDGARISTTEYLADADIVIVALALPKAQVSL